jgi:hypothetical protein
MVEWLATIFGRFNEHLQILYYLLLSAEIAKMQRSEGIFKVFLASAGIALFPDVKTFFNHIIGAKIINYFDITKKMTNFVA